MAPLSCATQGRRLNALIWALALEVFRLGLWPAAFLVGRSDSTAICFLSLFLWTYLNFFKPEKGGKGNIVWLALTGLFGALTFFTNWRYFPAVRGFVFVLAGERLCASRSAETWRVQRNNAATVIVSGMAAATAIIFASFGSQWSLYHRHSIEFFFGKAGWGIQHGDYQFFPTYVIEGHRGFHLVLLLGFTMALIFQSPDLPRRSQLWVWYPFLLALWLTTTIGFWLNAAGAIVAYFGQFYVILPVHLVRAIDWSGINHLVLRPIGAGGEGPAAAAWPVISLQPLVLRALFCALPWGTVLHQGQQLAERIAPAESFLATAHRVTAGGPIYSESCFSFETIYRGQTIDMGDVVSTLLDKGYFPSATAQVVKNSLQQFAASPPRYVMADGTGREAFGSELVRSYHPVISSQEVGVETVPTLTLYERNRADGGAAPSASLSVRPSRFAAGLEPILKIPGISRLEAAADDHTTVDLQHIVVDLQKELQQTQSALRQATAPKTNAAAPAKP